MINREGSGPKWSSRAQVLVIDVGIHRLEDSSSEKGYKLVGDVDLEGVRERASLISPAPGGVGPMTVAMLLVNTLKAAKLAASKFNSPPTNGRGRSYAGTGITRGNQIPRATLLKVGNRHGRNVLLFLYKYFDKFNLATYH